MKKTDMVLLHLKTKGSISSMESFMLYGETRLADVVYRLKRKGYNILTYRETGPDRWGNETTYARYILAEREQV